MDSPILLIVVVAVAALGGVGAGYALRRAVRERSQALARADSEAILADARRQVENLRKETVLEAKELWYREKVELEKDIREEKMEVQKLERRLQQREEQVDRKLENLDNREKELKRQEGRLHDREVRLEQLGREREELVLAARAKLEEMSRMTAQEARAELIQSLESEARADASLRIRKMEEELKETAERQARKIISLAIQRCAADHVAESTVSVVDLPSDEMKGRIIGREGRNIRALEIATGVDLIIDDTPEAVILSAYDPYKREITRIALVRLMADGRIHPGRIEEVVSKVKKEMEGTLKEEGERAAFEVGVDALHPEILRLLGRLKYRTSYSQNVLHHSKEVAIIAGNIAAELEADVRVAKRAGLLHDLGKAVDHHLDGTHTQLGLDILRKYGESRAVIDAVAAHHEDVEPASVEAVIIQAADTLSAARPGARREMLETYVKRLQKLEEIGDSFKGVEKTFAVQAGREVRVIVRPEQVSDTEMTFLAREIAKKIETEASYPGEIRVTVIRETRAVERAK